MCGLFAMLSSNSDIYFNSKYTKFYYISLNSQKKELSELMTYMKIRKEVPQWGGQEMEYWFFNFYFLNQDISLNIYFPSIKIHILIENILMEGTVSQNVYLGLSFNFMKSRKIFIKKYQKSSRFLT